ncbi:MAG: hypothetical protein K8S62_15530 [Candidatus Sabulitectum sp.]|nr:hypothetical protein [Candidatus Sabulitectum sp.]
MKYLAVLSALILLAACSDSPNTPRGTLPIVQNCRIMKGECKGDTVIIAWDSLSVEVDGYRVWFSDTDPGTWNIIVQVEGTTTQHIATRTGYYCVDAIKGIDFSEDQSNKANDRASMHMIEDTLTVDGTNGIRFKDSHTSIGDASQASFAQDIYIHKEGDTILFYRGNFEPETYPGGSNSMIASGSNYLAPGPGDSAWKNSTAAQDAAGFFVQLENGDYASFWVDTVFNNSVVLNSNQYQAITGLRLFNPFIF